MKKTYHKPATKVLSAQLEGPLMSNSGPEPNPEFDIDTNLLGLGGFGGGGNASAAD